MNILDEEKKFGVAILERQMLEKFRTLWEGPLNPENLDLIEQTIRAFLVSPTLSVSWVKNDLWDTVAISPDEKFVFDSDDFYEPLDETCLMYEFTNFKNNHPISSVSVASVSFAAKLSKNLRKHLLNCRDILKKHLSNRELKQFGI